MSNFCQHQQNLYHQYHDYNYNQKQQSLNNERTNDFVEMKDLSNRFLNFLNLVKSETKKSEYLQTCLIEEKRKFIRNSSETNSQYHDELIYAKKYLNDLCLSLSCSLVKERHHRIISEWFTNLLVFEQENLKLKNQVFSSNKIFESSSPAPLILPETTGSDNTFGQNLSNLSTISVSQSSLLSCSSSISFPVSLSSSSTKSDSTGEIYTPETSSSPCFSLETYLSNLSKNRAQLKEEYDKKYAECQELKENVNVLTGDLDNLNNKLDNTKLENLNLKDNIKNLKKEIEFQKNNKSLNMLDSSSINDNDEELWIKNELDRLRKEITEEYEKLTYEDLEIYENSLKEQFMNEIDQLQKEFDEASEKYENESNEILNEITELNRNLADDLEEFKQLREINNALNKRLICLSSKFCLFNGMNQEQKDILSLKYSINQLTRQLDTIKTDVKTLKQELSSTKNKIIKSDALELILSSKIRKQDDEISNQTNPSLSIKDQEQFLEKLFKKNQIYPFKLRPYYAQIENTKSNLFSYFVVKFDLIYHNYNCTNNTNKFIKLNSSNSSSILNSLTIDDTIDGHTITIQNSHKILDIDLSDWKLKREVYYTNKNFTDYNLNINLENLNLNCSSNIDTLVLVNEDKTNESAPEVIEYKFPKGFKLKRRKKINLIAAGVGSAQNQKESQTNKSLYKSKSLINCNFINDLSKKKKTLKPSVSSTALNHAQSVTKLTQMKCACCACKMLIKRKGDADVIEIKEVSNWGSGLLVVTKLVNSKNMIKLANYKFLKHIWVNNHEK